jgi:hypothetical protein
MISDINLTVILIMCILFLIVERCNTKTQQEHFKYIKLKNDGDLDIWEAGDLKNEVRETIKGPILGQFLNNGKTKIDKINGNLTVAKFTMDENSIVKVNGKHTDPSQNLTSPKISVGEFEKELAAGSGIRFRSYEADAEYGSGIILADNENGEFRHNAAGIHHGTTSLIKYNNTWGEDQVKIHSKIRITGSPLPTNATGILELTEVMIERYNALRTIPVLNPAWTIDEIWQGLLKRRYTTMRVTINVDHEADIIISPRTDHWAWVDGGTKDPEKISTQLFDRFTGTWKGADTVVPNDMSIGKYFPFLSGQTIGEIKTKPTRYLGVKPSYSSSKWKFNGMQVETKNCGSKCGPGDMKFTSSWGGQSIVINRDNKDCDGHCTVVLTFTHNSNGPWKGDWTKRP